MLLSLVGLIPARTLNQTSSKALRAVAAGGLIVKIHQLPVIAASSLALFSDRGAKTFLPCSGIIHLWSMKKYPALKRLPTCLVGRRTVMDILKVASLRLVWIQMVIRTPFYPSLALHQLLLLPPVYNLLLLQCHHLPPLLLQHLLL